MLKSRLVTGTLTATAISLAGLIGLPAAAQDVINIRLATGHQEGSTYQSAIDRYAQVVEEQTNGAIKIDVVCCGQLGGERQIAEGISLGTIDMSVLGTTGSKNLDTLFMPFLFRDFDHVMAFTRSDVAQELADRYYAEMGVHLIGWAMQGGRQFLTNKRAIRTAADLDGIKLRAPELPSVVLSLRALGANPTVLPFQELYLAMQQGTVDGWEGPVNYMYDFKHWEIGKYLSVTDWIYNLNYVVINDPTWNRLSAEQQQILRDAWKPIGEEVSNQIARENEDYFKAMEANGVEVARDIDMSSFREATKDVWREIAPPVWGDGLYERIQAVQ